MTYSNSLTLLSLILIAGISSCSSDKKNPSHLVSWVGHSIDLKHIVNERDSFIMINAEGQKVGGMIWEKSIKGNRYIHKDVSYFDDGSVYEEASFHYQLDPIVMDSVQVDMEMPTASLRVNYRIEGKHVVGPFIITHDTSERVMAIDTVYNFDIIRPEIYSLVHALVFDSISSIPLKVFSPEGRAIADAKITYRGKETIDTGYGTFDCIKLGLFGGNVIPDNMIWISESPRRIVKVFVPGPELNILLASYSN